MGSSLSLIHLPAQSGKTRKMTELINKWNKLFDLSGNNLDCLNVIFTSNSKLLTKQTAGRITTDVDNVSQISDLTSDEEEEMSIEMDVGEKASKTLAWLSSSKKLSTNDVFAKITSDDDDNEINNLICCTNKVRMTNVWTLLKMLNKKYMKKRFDKRVNIWIDEADACIKTWESYLDLCEELIDSNFIQNIVLVSATMGPVYNHLHQRRIEPNLRTYENTHAPVYHKYSDSYICHEYSENAKYPEVQLKTVLENNPEIVSAGSRVFCPGNKAKRSHEDICNELLEIGFNVLLLNGVHKEIRFWDKSPPIKIVEQLESDLEISKTLNKLYYELELFNSPFAVTGHLCIGRGITFASQSIDGKEFLFTHGIIPEVINGDEGYQMVARCCGNIKGFASYQVPKLFVSERTHSLIKDQEILAVEFASALYQEGVETVKVTRNMLKEATGKEDACDKEEKKKEKAENLHFIMGGTMECTSLEQANIFCKKIKPNSRIEKEISFKKDKNEDGEYVCTTTKKGERKFTYEEFMSESLSWNAASLLNMKDLNAGKLSKVIKPVYSGNEVVWLVRWGVHVIKGDIKRPDISQENLARAIKDKTCRIELVNDQLQVIMNNV
jgi:hypothetical protein